MESFESGCRVLIIYLNFDWKSAKITIFRLTYGYFLSLLAWISLWLSIYISSILLWPFWMVFFTRKAFKRIFTTENRGRMSQIRPKSGKIGSKTIYFVKFLCVITSIHSNIFRTHNLMRLFPENFMTSASFLRVCKQFLSMKQ